MLPNEERLKLEVFIRPMRSTQEVIESELIKVNYSIERKWAILDDYSLNWSLPSGVILKMDYMVR